MMEDLSVGELAQLDQEVAGLDMAVNSLTDQWPSIHPDWERPERLSCFLRSALDQLGPSSIAAVLAAAIDRLSRIQATGVDIRNV